MPRGAPSPAGGSCPMRLLKKRIGQCRSGKLFLSLHRNLMRRDAPDHPGQTHPTTLPTGKPSAVKLLSTETLHRGQHRTGCIDKHVASLGSALGGCICRRGCDRGRGAGDGGGHETAAWPETRPSPATGSGLPSAAPHPSAQPPGRWSAPTPLRPSVHPFQAGTPLRISAGRRFLCCASRRITSAVGNGSVGPAAFADPGRTSGLWLAQYVPPFRVAVELRFGGAYRAQSGLQRTAR